MGYFEVLDIETFVINDCIEVYCICCTDDGNILDFHYGGDDVFLKFLKNLTKPQYCF